MTTTSSDPIQSRTDADVLEEYGDTRDIDMFNNAIVIRDVPSSIQDRWQTIARVDWNDSNLLHSVIYENTNPFTALFHTTTAAAYVNAPLARYVSAFRSFKSDVEYKVTIQGNANAYGGIMVALGYDKKAALYPCYFTDPKKVFINANDPGSVSIFCPWTEPTYMRPNDSGMQPIPTFRIFVAAPLRNASAPAGVACKILVEARPRNMKVMGPTNMVTFQSKEALDEAKRVTGTGNMLSTGAKTLGKVAFKAIKAGAGAINPLIPMALDLLPFDRPIDASNVVRQVPVHSDIFSQVSGSTLSRRLGIAPVAPLPALPHPDSDDYSSFDKYKKIWTSQAFFSIPASTAVDTVIASVPVVPSYTQHQTNLTNPSRTQFNFGPLQWLAQSHGAWRGSLEYRLMVYMPTGANAQMRITVDTFSNTNFSSADAGNQFNMLVDLKGNTIVDFSVPYQELRPYVPIPARPTLNTFTANNLYGRWFLHFTLVTPVVSPFANDIVPRVELLVRGGDDFEVLLPQSPITPTGVTFQSAVKPLFAAETVVADAVSLVDKVASWTDFYKMGYAVLSSVLNIQIPNHMRHTFTHWRGSQRVMCTANSDGLVRMVLPNTVSREGPAVAWMKNGSIETFEIPYNQFFAWAPTRYNNGYGVHAFQFTAPITTETVRSFTDDLQLFFPAVGPTLDILDTVTN